MKYLVVTNKHELHPLANLLLSEDQDVDVVVWKRRYEAAWAGRLNLVGRFSQGEMTRETWDPYKELAKKGELTVLTNVPRARDIFDLGDKTPTWFLGGDNKEPLTEPVRFGGWVQDGQISLPHILVYDTGLWPGGLGPRLPGGVVLIRLLGDDWQRLVPLVQLQRGVAGHQGLFNVQFRAEIAGGVEYIGGLLIDKFELGWNWLQTAAVLTNVESLTTLLSGQLLEQSMTDGVNTLRNHYSTAVPFSLPPFPTMEGKGESGVRITGLTEQQLASTLWYDVTVDQQDRALMTAGLDGLVGISTGVGHTLLRALGTALSVPQTLEWPELQYRPDVGRGVGLVESTLENLGLQV